MKKVVILLLLAVMVATSVGCETAKQSVSRNLNYLVDDTIRCAGLHEASALHARDLVPWSAYEPYRGYP